MVVRIKSRGFMTTFIKSTPEEVQHIYEKLKNYIEVGHGPAERESFSFCAKSSSGEFLGGISGFVHWNWVYISQLWVEENYRAQGIGEFLLQSLVQWATGQKHSGIYVDTFSKKTTQFYIKNGFIKFGEIPNFPTKGNSRFFLKTELLY
jgi:GNAT superfamily N-acetyltransferase